MRSLLCALLGHAWKKTGVGRWSEEDGWRHEYQCARCLKRVWE